MRVREGLTVAVVATLLTAGPAAAQEMPPDGPERVAQVGTVAISKAEFDHWFASASRSQFERTIELEAPGYADCVAAKRKQRAARRWRPLAADELRTRCRIDHGSLRRQTLQFLVQGQWVEQEAAAQGVQVGPRRVDRLFESQKRLAFPRERAYQRFLRSSGATEADIKYRIRLDALQNAMTRRLTARAKPVTERDVARYRAAHPRRFADVDRAKANRRIRRLLVSQREQGTLTSFIEDFRSRYRALTWCAPGYAIAECGAIAPPPAE
jgi:hypothetical protein